MRAITAAIRRTHSTWVLIGVLGVLAPVAAQAQEKSFAEMIRKFNLAPFGEPESDVQVKARSAAGHLVRMEFPQASRAINEGLQLAPRNSQLHFLNGFVYHLQSKQGDAHKLDLAIEGYQQALRLERSNWIAQEFLGLAYLDQKRFDDARKQFSDALLMTPDSSASVHGLMVAAYMTGDAATACAMADRFKELTPAPAVDFVRSSVSVYAACGQIAKAERMQATLADMPGQTEQLARSGRRLAQWKMAQTSAAPLQLAQAFQLPLPPKAVSRPEKPEAAAAAPETPATAIGANAPVLASSVPRDGSPRMVLVDVVLVSAQEIAGTSKGVNLLNALTLQLGSVAGNVAAFSRVRTDNSTGGAAAAISTAITRAVTVPALSYSLNIANANSSVNEVLARPTLAAMEGLPSEFFSGTNLSAGVVSTSSQGGTTVVPIEKRFGIKLAVTPTFLPNGSLQLKVEAQRTALNANSDNPKVAYQIETGEITANANVVMRMGETLVLSGMSEKSTNNTRDGVPLLQDVPLMQYLFSHQRTNDIQRSVLILITPRAPAFTTLPEGSPDALFRHFREGDVVMQRWERMDTTGARLRQAFDFLYY